MAAAALAIGAGLSAYGSYTAGQQKQDAYEVQARQKRATAAEVQIGANREIELASQSFERTKAAQLVAFGKSGVSVSSGSTLSVLEQSAGNFSDQTRAIQQAADYRKSTLLTDADQSEIFGQQASDAGTLGAMSAIVGGIAKNPYMYDQKVSGSETSGSIITDGGGKMSSASMDSAAYDPSNYSRLHYSRGYA